MARIWLEAKGIHPYQLERERSMWPPWVVGELLIDRDCGDMGVRIQVQITEDDAKHLRDKCQELLDNLEAERDES